jgi:tetratricopeptide (TPR) repeat protein
MYLFKRDYEEARKAYQVLVDADDPSSRTAGREYMAYVPRAQGKWGESIKVLMEGIAADELETDDYKYAGPASKLLLVVFPYSPVTWEDGLAYARSSTDLFRRFDPSSPMVLFWETIELFWELRGGQITPTQADSSYARLRLEAGSQNPENLPTLAWWGGCIAVEQERYENAIELFEEAIGTGKPWVWYYPLLECYLEVGRIDEAVKLAERLLGWYDNMRARSLWSVEIHCLAGKAYQAAGQTDKAMEQFETFLMIWKDADPIFPEIDDAKQRVEVLKGSR